MGRDRERQLRFKYWEKAIAPETLFLLSANDALDFLEDAAKQGLVLAGVDGFRIVGGAYEPQQEFSTDSADENRTAAEFMLLTKSEIQRGAADGIWFEVVFDGGT